MRNILLKVIAPAVMAIGGVPAIASAHSHGGIGFSFGFGGFYRPAYCAPAVCAPAPAVVYAPTCAPVVVTPPVVYTAPAVVYAPPAVVYTQPVYVVPAPVVVYSRGYYYPHTYFYHVPCYRR
jgi:hypothetical protein